MRTSRSVLWFLVALVAFLVSSPSLASPPGVSDLDERLVPSSPDAPVSRPWDLPNQCETIAQKVWSKKKQRYFYKRARHKLSSDDRQRVRAVIRLVAEEMGADYRYLWAKSIIESSGNPEAIHILNADFEANRSTWRRFSYSEKREEQLEELQEVLGARSHGYWRAKSELSRIRKYKGNLYWDDTQVVHVHGEDEYRSTESPSIWSWGYGLYGMNAVYFTEDWDASAPPWILCAEDGLIATVVQIWALRHGLAECVGMGYANNWDTANRRISRGKCEPREPGSKYVYWSEQMGLDRSSRPKLGTKWDGKSSDRKQLLTHMRTRIEEECLTPELYRSSKCKNPKARGYSAEAAANSDEDEGAIPPRPTDDFS